MENVWTRLLMLATMCCLVACQSTPTIPIGGTDLVAETEARLVKQTCDEAWKTISYSSKDTEQTQLEVRAGNAARSAYCGEVNAGRDAGNAPQIGHN